MRSSTPSHPNAGTGCLPSTSTARFTASAQPFPICCGSSPAVSSTSAPCGGQVGASCEAAYSATKGAILALTKALAQELGPSGIRVNAVAPGVIQTDMCAHVDPSVMEGLRQQTPIERLGTPEDIARAMVYLADAAFITGQVLPVNGGFVIT